MTEDGGLRAPPVAGVREDGNAVVVALQGELDLYNLEDVRDALATATASGARPIVVDLSAVEFMDSTVIGALVEAHKRIGSDFRVAAPTALVLRTIQIAGVDSYLGAYETVAA